MASQFKLRATLVACALAIGSAPVLAANPSFDFSSVPASIIDNTPLDNGANAVTVGLTDSSGVTATFSDPNSSGNFVFSQNVAGFLNALNSPTVLSESGSSGDTLDVSFSQAIGSLQFAFSLGNLSAGDLLNVALYNGTTLVTNVQDATTQTYGNTNQWSTGSFSYNGAAFTSMVITGTGVVSSSNPLGLDSINIAPSAPEPTTWALMGAGLLAIAGFARRRAA